MRASIAMLMIASLTIHAVLGCCWQYADACLARLAETVAHADACAHDPCCGCDDESTAAGSERGPAPPCSCQMACSAACRFLPDGQRVQVDRPGVSPLAAVIPADHRSAVSYAAADSRGLLAFGLRAEPPVRLHLAHRLLLI